MAFELAEGFVDLTLRDRAFMASTKMIDAKLKSLQMSLSKVTVQAKMMLMVGAGVAAGAVKAFSSFEEQLAMVSTMLDKQTMSYMPRYEKGLRAISIEFGESTKTLSKGLYDILSASIPAAEAMGVLEDSVKAARAGITSTAISADAITTILNSYSLTADKARDVSDLLFAIVKRGKLTFEELAHGIGRVASIAAVSGLSLEEVGAAIATMTRAGLQADIAMTSLRALMMSFLKPTEDSKDMARKFGIELNTSTLRAIGLTGVLKRLKGATAEQIGVIIPNIRGLAGFAAALQNVEGQAYDLNLMMNRSGLTQEAFEKTTATLHFKMQQLWQVIKLSAASLGETYEPVLRKVADRLIELNEQIAKFIELKGDMIASITMWTGGVLLAVIALEKLLKILLLLKVVALFFLANPLGQALALSTAAVYVWSKFGDQLGEIITGLSKIKRELAEIEKLSKALESSFDKFLASEKAVEDIRRENLLAGRSDYLDELRKEQAEIQKILQRERDRLEVLKDLASIRGQKYHAKLIEEADLTQKEIRALEHRLELIGSYVEHLEGINQEMIKLDAMYEQSLIENVKAEERIRDLELAILSVRSDSVAQLQKITLEEAKALDEWEKRVAEIAKEVSRDFIPSTLYKEREMIEAYYTEQRRKIIEAEIEEKKAKEKQAEEDLLRYRIDLEREYIRVTKGDVAAQLYDISKQYEEMFEKFKEDAQALQMLDLVTLEKIRDAMASVQEQTRVSFVEPRDLWRQMMQSINRPRSEVVQENILQELIKIRIQAEDTAKRAERQRDEQKEVMTDASGGSIRR